jgi:O-antigen/teichoic acid export membrane protein
LFGWQLLRLFGPQFTQGYGILFVAAIGPLIRAAIGPVERLLNMLDQQIACARAYALAFVLNLVLCLLLVPKFGGYGAAAATSLALAFETVLLYRAAKKTLGYSVLPFGRGQ